MKDTFKITGIEYSLHNPSVYGEDFDIVMTPSEIISASFFIYDKDKETPLHLASRSHARLRSEVYKDIVDTILSFAHTLEEKPEAKKKGLFDRLKNKNKITETDGPKEFLFALTWSDGTESVRKEYLHPSDRRFFTVIELLEEAVNPQGKEITRFSIPDIDGIIFFNGEVKDKNYYSYQSTLKERGQSEERYYFHHYTENGEPKYDSMTIGEKEWQKILHVIHENRFDKRPGVPKNPKSGCTIYISDGTERRIKISDKEAEELREAFSEAIKK